MERDPVCGMHIEPESGVDLTYQDRLYTFCSTECRDQFIADPEKYEGRLAVALPAD